VELLSDADLNYYFATEKDEAPENSYEFFADFLLANGVIVPPCKVGDTVYQIQPTRNRVQAYEVTSYKFNGISYFFSWVLKDRKGFYENVEGFSDIQIGKTVFLAKEEAEQALVTDKNVGRKEEEGAE
jgi:hypothetical protein